MHYMHNDLILKIAFWSPKVDIMSLLQIRVLKHRPIQLWSQVTWWGKAEMPQPIFI